MDRRTIIAIIISGAILLTYPFVLKRFFPETQPSVKQGQQAASLPERQSDMPQETLTTAKTGKAGADAVLPDAKEELIVVETPLYRTLISNRGGIIKNFELKKHRASIEKDNKPVNINREMGLRDVFMTRVSLDQQDAGVAAQTPVFKPSSQAITVLENEEGEIVFSSTMPSGLGIEKKYRFSGSNYMVDTEVRILNTSKTDLKATIDAVINSSLSGKTKIGGYHLGPVIFTKGKIKRQSEKEPEKAGSGDMQWLGLEDKYFLAALIPIESKPDWSSSVKAQAGSTASIGYQLKVPAGAGAGIKYKAFLGPKEYNLLSKDKNGLGEAVEFGFFGPMARPMLIVLNFFERYLGNYGLAIILLTVLIKVIFYPLTKYSLKSMKGMQTIQPQFAALKEKYKDNKEKMNKELMELYKRHKINPLSGCLPMVLQIPVFIALYEVLYVAIELRHAPFFFWIRDLSDKDPYYITPLIMGATMFIQQKMNPTSPDPTQAKIMLIMPVIFTFMFLKFPSGLVIYWLVNNVLSIAQQYYVQKAPQKA